MKEPKNLVRFALRAALAAFAVFIVFSFFSGKPGYANHIVLGDAGFSPSAVKIPVGTTVTFENKTNKPFWPASNFHPTHLLLRSFDPRKPVFPGETWEFTFTRSGHWRYHNHLKAQEGGEIIVFDSATGNASACQPPSTEVADKLACWAEEVETSLAREGVVSAFALIRQLYANEQDFRAVCHDVTHLVGEATYRIVRSGGSVGTTEDVVNCGYGFFHGFIEALLFDGRNITDAFVFCRNFQKEAEISAVEPSTIYSCFHGIGHGLFDSTAVNAWGNASAMVEEVLGICERIEEGGYTAEVQKQCATGVFNALANGYKLQNYGLVFDANDPLAICTQQENKIYRNACAIEVSLAYILLHDLDEKSAVSFLRALAPEDAQAGVFAYVADQVTEDIATLDPSTLPARCAVFGPSLRPSCLDGMELALLERSAPGVEYQAGLEFCASSLLSAAEQDTCWRRIVPIFLGMYDRIELDDICNKVPIEYQALCIR
jgi:plastocyanin